MIDDSTIDFQKGLIAINDYGTMTIVLKSK